jgi:hypothetical protein
MENFDVVGEDEEDRRGRERGREQASDFGFRE